MKGLVGVVEKVLKRFEIGFKVEDSHCLKDGFRGNQFIALGHPDIFHRQSDGSCTGKIKHHTRPSQFLENFMIFLHHKQTGQSV